MSETKLLKCPFCGGEATLEEEPIGKNQSVFSVACKDETCITQSRYYYDEESAIKHWNTRKPMERIVERLEDNSFFTEPTYDIDGYSNDDEFEVIRLDKAIEIVKEKGVIE